MALESHNTNQRMDQQPSLASHSVETMLLVLISSLLIGLVPLIYGSSWKWQNHSSIPAGESGLWSEMGQRD